MSRLRSQAGQATLLALGAVAAVLAGGMVLTAFGQALGAKGRLQRGADLAAMSAARQMRADYPRLFEAAVFENGLPNPHHLSTAQYEARARSAALDGGSANGLTVRTADVSFPGGGFAPVRVRVAVREAVAVRVDGNRTARRRRVAVGARAAAEIAAPTASMDFPATASGGGYSGPLAYRMGKPMRPDVARAFDRMAAAARREAGLSLSVTSGFRSDAEQARLFKANPNPKWVAPPGTSLHRYGTELDLGPDAAYGWLAKNSRRFGFIHRYAWEPWHYGYGANPRDDAHPARYERGSWEPPGGDHGRIKSRLPSFVPPRFHDPIARAALRWNVPMDLLAAQLYAESGFNPFANSGAGAQGIAQFMPGTARAYGLDDPYDPEKAIDAQAHLMSDLLREFGGRVSLALAAYNAGPGAVVGGRVPAIPETRAYVARILALLGGAGDIALQQFDVRLVE